VPRLAFASDDVLRCRALLALNNVELDALAFGLDPSSGVMKPKPLLSLNHFTIPNVPTVFYLS